MTDTTAPLADLAPLLAADDTVRAVVARAATAAVPAAARAIFVAALAGVTTRRPILVATPTGADADRLAHDLGCFLPPHSVEWFPAWETLPFERVSPSLETMGRRLRVLWRLRHGGDATPTVVVAPVRALVQRLGPHVEDVHPIEVRAGQVVDRDALIEELVAVGYRREYQVEGRGEVAVRGSIVDVYPVTDDHPVRIDLWGDEVDRLSAFAVADQRSTHDVDAVQIFPARELLPTAEVRARAEALQTAAPWGAEQWERLATGQVFDGMESWLPWLTPEERLLPDLLPDGAVVLLAEPNRMRDRAQELLDEEASLAATLAQTWDATGAFPRLSLPFDRLLAHTHAGATALLATPEGPDTAHLAGTAFAPIAGDADHLARRLHGLADDGYRVVIAAEGRGSAERLIQVLGDDGVDATPDAVTPGVIGVTAAPLDRGIVLPGPRLALIAEADLTGRRRVHRAPRGARRGADLYDALEPGDYVVHQTHGVARYGGMVQRAIGGVAKDYLLLEYKSGDKLYVPTDQVGIVRRYTGGETPTLHRMGGADFERTKARVRAATREIAQELVVLYRRRLASPGHAFSPDTPWQHEIEEAFPFEETPDQLRAIEDVKHDMEQPVPMDRLVCGDVGFGKTEVAVRAAFKAVQDGTQVAVLVPTTLLANQHGQTFRERFANYPVRVEVLSRFLSTKEQRSVVNRLAAGDVDVVVGTHRLLSDDVAFRDLGLLVIDEEQRFGVQHKEQIKALRVGVDVVTLTATPIPRTLDMSLTGIRDLSMVTTPPEDRQPILTYVGEYDDRAVAEALRRELLREGQMFFVHNQVKDIEFIAEHLRDLVPEARIAIAHGQMDESRLERVVLDFWEREYDVLVCTTIIESGLDIPTVNTLVVDRADRLGLAQLYQLRGRIGRRGQRAYAYLLHPRDRALTEEAYERLKTIGEFTDLGSGFKIAMRDLEIRGAGNLLGANQSGHIAAVGFDLYCQMVTEAVAELKGEPVPEPVEVTIDLPVDAHLPRDYVARDDVRMEAYRRLAAVTDPHDVDDVRAEWEDRYGPPPAAAEALLAAARLRAECVRLGIRSLAVAAGAARIRGLELRESQKVRLGRLAPGAKVSSEEVLIPLRVPAAETAETLTGLLDALVPRAGDVPVGSRGAVKRLQVLIAALVAVALVGGVTAYLVLGEGAVAYTARGQRVSQSDVDSELSALADNAALQRLIHQSQSAPLSTIPGSISSTYTAGWLSLRIAQTFADGVVARKHLGVNAVDRRAGEQLAVQLLGSETVIRSLPSSFRSNLRSRFARMATLTRALLSNPSPALVNAAFQACPSHRFVSHILVATLADAQSLKVQLTGGADFATLARQHSTDQASAVRGGDVGCLDSQQFVAPFAQAAQTLPIGQVSDPVQTQFGFHLIVVSNKPSSADIESVALAEVLGLARGSTVTVDPRYGVWDRRNGRVVSPVATRAPSSSTGTPATPTPTG